MHTLQSAENRQTFEERFCAKHGCQPRRFPDRVFWKCLHRHALPFAPVILLFNRDYFEADRELVANVRHAVRMSQVWEEVRVFFLNPKHQGWLRKRCDVRISARRVINLAREHLGSGGSRPPADPRNSD